MAVLACLDLDKLLLEYAHDSLCPVCLESTSSRTSQTAGEYLLTITHVSNSQHIMIDLGTGNNNKINWPMEDKQEMIDIIETVYRGASKGRGLVDFTHNGLLSLPVLMLMMPFFTQSGSVAERLFYTTEVLDPILAILLGISRPPRSNDMTDHASFLGGCCHPFGSLAFPNLSL